MCGICGKLILKDNVPEPDSPRAMCKTIVHRGPDDEGIYTAPHIGLGHQRLSMIDLSPGACPPLANEDRTVWLVFNDEVYNFQELLKQLQERGHQFAPNGDVEVVLHLYEDKSVARFVLGGQPLKTPLGTVDHRFSHWSINMRFYGLQLQWSVLWFTRAVTQ